jgi:hypothetical protein
MLGRFPFEEGEFAMKRFLFLALGIVLSAGVTFGQAGYIALYSDLARTSCYLSVTDAGGTKRVICTTWRRLVPQRRCLQSRPWVSSVEKKSVN